jgi:hypothetical protein
MIQLKEGMKAPSFEGTDQDGKTIKLSDFLGKKEFCISIPRTILRDAPRKLVPSRKIFPY